MSENPVPDGEGRRVLVKVRRYDGSESVLRRHSDPGLAQLQVDAYNEAYQTDACFMEDYDPAKDEWPTMSSQVARERVQQLLAARVEREPGQ